MDWTLSRNDECRMQKGISRKAFCTLQVAASCIHEVT